MNQRTEHRSAGIGAYNAELAKIRIWVKFNAQRRRWFLADDVQIHVNTLNSMVKHRLIKTAGRVGSKQTFVLQTGTKDKMQNERQEE